MALVGNSGNGKSTCLHLLQRFYDPIDGKVLIDNSDIRSLNIHSLRSSIASVGQEPVLFSTSIAENIRYGKPDATDQEVFAAAKSSGAHDFIARLPQGYNTVVGEGGSQFSGGQKQRIAIARALVQNPKILLLDEATAALDYHSEKYVQETLDRASEGRTTIVVSHRMSAIKNADRIVFIHKGQVVEDGTQNELIALQGHYYEMVKSTFHDLEESGESKVENLRDQYQRDEKYVGREMVIDFTKQKYEDEHELKQDSVAFWKSFKRILALIQEDRLILTIAISASVVLGFSLPLSSVVYAEVFAVSTLQMNSLN